MSHEVSAGSIIDALYPGLTEKQRKWYLARIDVAGVLDYAQRDADGTGVPYVGAFTNTAEERAKIRALIMGGHQGAAGGGGGGTTPGSSEPAEEATTVSPLVVAAGVALIFVLLGRK